MTLTRDFKQTVIERSERDKGFSKTRLDAASALDLSGEPEVAAKLRDLVGDMTILEEGKNS